MRYLLLSVFPVFYAFSDSDEPSPIVLRTACWLIFAQSSSLPALARAPVEAKFAMAKKPKAHKAAKKARHAARAAPKKRAKANAPKRGRMKKAAKARPVPAKKQRRSPTRPIFEEDWTNEWEDDESDFSEEE